MGQGRLFWKLFFGNALLMAATLAVFVWLILGEIDRIRSQELTEHLKAQALTIRRAADDKLDPRRAEELDRLFKDLRTARTDYIRYTFISADGTVLADSEASPRAMESHANRKEVRQALAEGWGEDTRQSQTTGRPTRYVAVRVGDARSPVGVVRAAMSVRTITERTRTTHRLVWTIGSAGVAAVILLALALARLWSRPIRRIAVTARSLSRGDLSARVPVTGSDELTTLARALNQMRDRLADHLETIERQRQTLESLVKQLHEGVVVAGPDGRIVLVNPAAMQLLGIPSSQRGAAPEGLAVEQCIPQHELQQAMLPARAATGVAARTAASVVPHGEQEVRLEVDGPHQRRSLLARISDISLPAFAAKSHEARGSVTGRLLVVTDISELTRTMQVKADFAANASHELRTPLSAIRAAVETLAHIDLARDAASARQFLDVIDRHSARMQAMVADLLDLSRLESSPRQFEPVPLDLRPFLADLHAHHEAAMQSKGLRWQSEVSDSLRSVVANPYLLRLILDNLVDNAIKFTDAGGSIRVSCRTATTQPPGPGAVVIEVSDTGCGIPDDEQARVFERFYQVERARSGADRGTGLGLSIVRHAVAAMGGTVTLRSRLGEGTHVTIAIPPPARTPGTDSR